MNNKQQKDALIDQLLIFMNEEIEESGQLINCLHFNFNEDGEDAISFMDKAKIPFEQLALVLNTCKSRKYIAQKVMGAGKYNRIELTEEGQGRAISVEAAKHSPKVQENTSTFTINTLNTHAPTQLGNHNTQNIENIFTEIIEKIDNAEATDAEKQEAKGRLMAFLEHPITNTAIGLSPAVIPAIFGAL